MFSLPQRLIALFVGLILALDLVGTSGNYTGEVVKIDKGTGYIDAGLKSIEINAEGDTKQFLASEEAILFLNVGDNVSVSKSLIFQRNKTISRGAKSYSSVTISNIFIAIIVVSCVFIATYDFGLKKIIKIVGNKQSQLPQPIANILYISVFTICLFFIALIF